MGTRASSSVLALVDGEQGETPVSSKAALAAAEAFESCFSSMHGRIADMMNGSNVEDLSSSRTRARDLIVREHEHPGSHSDIVIKFRTCVGILVAIFRKDTRKTVRAAIADAVCKLDALCLANYRDNAVVTDGAFLVIEEFGEKEARRHGGAQRPEDAQASV